MDAKDRKPILDLLMDLSGYARNATRAANEAMNRNDPTVEHYLRVQSDLYSKLERAVKRVVVHDDRFPTIVAFVGDEYADYTAWRESRGQNHLDDL